MKYTSDGAVSEIMKRSRIIKQKKQKQITGILSLCVVLTFFAGIGAGVYFTDTGGLESRLTSYGSFLLPGTAGGYVLAAVIAFTFGVALTLFILWWRGRTGTPPDGDKEGDNGEK